MFENRFYKFNFVVNNYFNMKSLREMIHQKIESKFDVRELSKANRSGVKELMGNGLFKKSRKYKFEFDFFETDEDITDI